MVSYCNQINEAIYIRFFTKLDFFVKLYITFSIERHPFIWCDVITFFLSHPTCSLVISLNILGSTNQCYLVFDLWGGILDSKKLIELTTNTIEAFSILLCIHGFYSVYVMKLSVNHIHYSHSRGYSLWSTLTNILLFSSNRCFKSMFFSINLRSFDQFSILIVIIIVP